MGDDLRRDISIIPVAYRKLLPAHVFNYFRYEGDPYWFITLDRTGEIATIRNLDTLMYHQITLGQLQRDTEPLYRISEVAEALGVGEGSLRRHCADSGLGFVTHRGSCHPNKPDKFNKIRLYDIDDAKVAHTILLERRKVRPLPWSLARAMLSDASVTYVKTKDGYAPTFVPTI